MSNGVELSIQASRVHYATPRKDVNLEDYTHMELAIFTKCYSFADIRKVTSVLNLVNRFTSYYDGAVFSYVPVDLIESLYQELK